LAAFEAAPLNAVFVALTDVPAALLNSSAAFEKELLSSVEFLPPSTPFADLELDRSSERSAPDLASLPFPPVVNLINNFTSSFCADILLTKNYKAKLQVEKSFYKHFCMKKLFVNYW
jgi:hypothetical protein